MIEDEEVSVENTASTNQIVFCSVSSLSQLSVLSLVYRAPLSYNDVIVMLQLSPREIVAKKLTEVGVASELSEVRELVDLLKSTIHSSHSSCCVYIKHGQLYCV